jgi:hypothetical protein
MRPSLFLLSLSLALGGVAIGCGGTVRADIRAETRSVPPMSSADLNGRALQIPRDLAGDPALWVVAFDRQHQPQVDRIFGLLKDIKPSYPGLVSWELPVIQDPGAITRWFIDNGMRSGISDTSVRAKVVTLYVPDRPAWLKAMGLSGTSESFAVVVGADGKVVASAAQSSIKTAAQLRDLLERARPPAIPAR